MKIKQTLFKRQSEKCMRQNRIWGTTLILAVLVSLTSCATVMRGDRRDVHFNSEPQGADVYINGDFFGRTPIMLQLKAGETCVVEFRKPGYGSEFRQLRSRIKAEWLILDVICGTVPLIVDAITGAWSSFNQKNFNVVMEKIETENK